jgi:predicted regulator of Ras-like GTPase activity (Roadblock/LC7/MglB family)
MGEAVSFEDLILTEEDVILLQQSLHRYLDDTGVRLAMLIARDGNLLVKQGDAQGMNTDGLCALAVGAFASSEALARTIGEENFNSIYHQGVRCNVYISTVGEGYLLLSIFDYNASAPLVRLQAKMTAEAAMHTLARAQLRTQTTKVKPAGEPAVDAAELR